MQLKFQPDSRDEYSCILCWLIWCFSKKENLHFKWDPFAAVSVIHSIISPSPIAKTQPLNLTMFYSHKLTLAPNRHDNFLRVVSLNLFFTIWTNLIKSNVFYNHIFIYYRNNHKYNIYIYIYLSIKFSMYQNKVIQFFSGIQKASWQKYSFFNNFIYTFCESIKRI